MHQLEAWIAASIFEPSVPDSIPRLFIDQSIPPTPHLTRCTLVIANDMGIFDSFVDMIAAATPWSEAEAEAVKDAGANEQTDEGEVKKDDSEQKDEDDNKEEEAEEEEEEEEEEVVDPKETFEEECRESKACAPAKHHYEECVERVTGNAPKLSPDEDCVEEFFHLTHCATQCAAPKLWKVLK